MTASEFIDKLECAIGAACDGNTGRASEMAKELAIYYETALQTIEDLEMELRVAGETD